jgi:hypothetical protein
LHALYASLDGTLKKYGKGLYPLNFWNENAEILWVAAFVAISLRTFFIQPFRIPTNSMFPSFSGMQTKVYPNSIQPPNYIQVRTLHQQSPTQVDAKVKTGQTCSQNNVYCTF